MGEILLEIRGLSVDYGLGDEPVHAVDDVDLVIRRGEVVGLAGESGSGKSTLAYAVARLLRDPGVITGGEAYFYDWPKGSYDRRAYDTSDAAPSSVRRSRDSWILLTDDSDAVRAVRWSEIAVVFQSALDALNPVLRIGKLIDDVLKTTTSDLNRAERQARAEELLEIVGISPDRLSSYPHELSGGMRQRVMIAVAVALQPQPADHGRADDGARRGDPARNPRRADGPARAARLQRPVHHPRPVAADRDRGHDRGDVRRPAGREGAGQGAVPRAPAPLHLRSHQVLPVPARREEGDDRHRGLAARPA